MSNAIKMIAAFAGGALAGAGASFIISKVISDKNLENAVEERIEAVREKYEALYSKKVKKEAEILEKAAQSATVEEVAEKLGLEESDLRNYISEKEIIRDESYGSPSEEDIYNASPMLISETRFSEERLTYKKRKLIFWEQDAMLTDDDGDEEEPLDISKTAGYQALDEFRKDPELEEIFVRNDRLGEDYYIVRSRTPFDEVEHYGD